MARSTGADDLLTCVSRSFARLGAPAEDAVLADLDRVEQDI